MTPEWSNIFGIALDALAQMLFDDEDVGGKYIVGDAVVVEVIALEVPNQVYSVLVAVAML
jgi:hypothetical protein